MSENKRVMQTMLPEPFLRQLSLMNVTEEFSNTCKTLLQNYAMNKNVQDEIIRAFISLMKFEDIDIVHMPQDFLDSMDYTKYDLAFHPLLNEAGNNDGFEVELVEIEGKAKGTLDN